MKQINLCALLALILSVPCAAGDDAPAVLSPPAAELIAVDKIWHNGLLWVSYYSSHDGKAAIYRAKVRLSLEQEVSRQGAKKELGHRQTGSTRHVILQNP